MPEAVDAAALDENARAVVKGGEGCGGVVPGGGALVVACDEGGRPTGGGTWCGCAREHGEGRRGRGGALGSGGPMGRATDGEGARRWTATLEGEVVAELELARDQVRKEEELKAKLWAEEVGVGLAGGGESAAAGIGEGAKSGS